MSTQAALGQAALKNSDYPTAIKHLSSALRESSSPLWLIQRSTAYQRAGQHDLALADADNAVLAAVSRARRELVATAQFRRGVALHGMGRYGDARMCFNWCHKKNEKEKGLTIWLAKVKSDYEKAGGEEAECNKLTVKEVPDKVEEVKNEKLEKTEKVNGKKEDANKENVPAALPPPLAPTPKDKIRHEWYQSGPQVSLTIFAKGVPKEQAEIIIEEENLEVRFPVLTSDTTYDFTVSPLFSKIDPTQSTFRITPHKIEIALHKAMPGLKWSALEGTQSMPSNNTSSAPSTVNSEPKTEKSPAYPTSSRTGPKNWDTLATDALKAERKGGKENMGDDEFEGEEIDGFFKQIYKNADPDTRRAMIKSYQESNGTALSTNWSDVEKGPVETKPPDGLEAKKWES